MLVLSRPGVSENGGGLTVATVVPCSDGSGDISPPDTVFGLVPVVPLILERYPAVFIVNQINYPFRRFSFVIFI